MIIVVHGDCVGKKTSQVFVFRLRRLVPNARFIQYAKDFGRQITGEHKGKFLKEDKLQIHIDWFTSNRITIRDGVNMEQSIWDLLQDYEVIHNDSQFYKWSGTKNLDKLNPRVEIKIEKFSLDISK